jgi:hypothetical protein
MTSRVLPPAEWPRLAGTELAPIISAMGGDTTTVFVVEDDTSEIVGCWSLLTCAHMEGLWIAPAHRRAASVLRRLMVTMRKTLEERQIGAVWTSAMDDEIATIVKACGGMDVPGKHFVVPVQSCPT